MNDHAFFSPPVDSDVGDETIAALRHRLNVVFAFLTFSERLSQYRNVLREVVLFDKTVRPNLLHQLFLCQHVARVFEQHQQGIENFRRERHLAIPLEEKALVASTRNPSNR